MACCSSRVIAEQTAKSRAIDKELKLHEKVIRKHIKLLLLGAGESGKSTIAKQLKIIHLNGFTQEEKVAAKSVIYSNIISSIKILIDAANRQGIGFCDQPTAQASELIAKSECFAGPLEADYVNNVIRVWADPGVKSIATTPNPDLHVADSTVYFLDNVERIAAVDYVPNAQDILRARSRTTGARETSFEVDGYTFRIVDVGGQRSERRKWASCFDDVTAVIFCVSLSEYDMTLAEDETQNRMHESLLLFKNIINMKVFETTPIIIFLNKRDIFAEKITKVDLKICFPEYEGGQEYDAASKFINKRFLGMNDNPKKLIYSHFTCATDTDNIAVVFKAVKDIVLRQGLQSMGIME